MRNHSVHAARHRTSPQAHEVTHYSANSNLSRISSLPQLESTVGPPRDHGALHRHRHASATTLRLISLSPRGILQWPEEQSRSGCGQDGGNADQSQHRRMWRCRSSCPLILARPSPPCQPSCSQPPASVYRPRRAALALNALPRARAVCALLLARGREARADQLHHIHPPRAYTCV